MPSWKGFGHTMGVYASRRQYTVAPVVGESAWVMEALVCVVESGGRFEMVRVYVVGGGGGSAAKLPLTLLLPVILTVHVSAVPVHAPLHPLKV
jgi:hypothetical protein